MDEDDVLRYHFITISRLDLLRLVPPTSSKDLMRDKLRKDPEECVEYAITYAKGLETSFRAVKQITEAYQKDEEGGMLSKIFMLERMGNIFPLLIASWLRFGDDGPRLEGILKLLETFIVRVYLVRGYRSHTGASTFNRMANRVHRKRLGYDSLLGELRKMTKHTRMRLSRLSEGGWWAVLRAEFSATVRCYHQHRRNRLMDIEEVRETLNRYYDEWAVNGLPDKGVSVSDGTRFVHLLLQARTVMAIIDGYSWNDHELGYLERVHLRPLFGTLSGIATTTAIDPGPWLTEG